MKLVSVVIMFFLIFQSTIISFSMSKTEEAIPVDPEEMYQYHESWDISSSPTVKFLDIPRHSVVINDQSTKKTVGGSMNSAWPMQGHDVVHTCRSPYITALNPGIEMWRVSGDYLGEVESSAVIDNDGIIYFGTMGSDHTLYTLYPNGTKKWNYIASGLIWCTPAVAEDESIYFGTWGLSSYFHALNPNGTLKWLFDTGPSNSPVIAEDGTIYVGGDNSNVYALNPNGTLKWSYDTGYNVMGCPAIGEDGTIFIGSVDHYFYALYPNGTMKWRFDTGSVIKGSASIAVDGTIYVPSFNGYFYALYPNGTLKWQASTGDSIAAAGVALAEDGTIYVGTEQLRAYYPNGTLKWCINVQGAVYGTVPAVSADGIIYVSAGLDVVAVNPDGTERWRHTIADTHAYSSPSIGADGTVYVGSTWGGVWSYGYLHAFGAGEPKKIEIQNTVAGHWSFFGQDKGPTNKNNTVILCSVPVKINVYSPGELQSLHFYVDGTDQYNITSPPFEWNMNRRYGKLFPLQHTITITAYYQGGCSWTESIRVWYFHLRKN